MSLTRAQSSPCEAAALSVIARGHGIQILRAQRYTDIQALATFGVREAQDRAATPGGC